ncbi:unnamed protein product [Peronospora farinosa]|uniref:CCHC-type domain-containing protein n=1 Tax=Peronospora farinosa TaxID=134698 RepID=A0AAV0TWU7_9STRA|nr:unnamed protein product [Peronospora farinosa]
MSSNDTATSDVLTSVSNVATAVSTVTSGIAPSGLSGDFTTATAPPAIPLPGSGFPAGRPNAGGSLPGAGGILAPMPEVNQVPDGGFGMKLDNKPPIMHGSFDLYAVELETFLRRIHVWGVIDNESVVRASTTITQFALMDNVARGTILHGILTADAELVCHEASAHAMWSRFVDKQTKREYANYIFARQLLYANKYTHDRNMNDWLREMEFQRNELQHYQKVLSDEEFAEIILSNVLQTHREVVRQLSKHYDPGIQRLAPSSAQVMYALRAESELDARSNETQIPNICAAQTTKEPNKRLQIHYQQPWKEKRRGRSQYKAHGSNHYQKSGGGSGKALTVKKYHGDNRECWNCHEKGHTQQDCTRPKYAIDESKSQLPERKRWENRKQRD